MENIDGVYLPKGTTSITEFYSSFNSGIFNLTIQPEQRIYKEFLTKIYLINQKVPSDI